MLVAGDRHANIGITLNLYSHVSEGKDRDAADRVAGLFTSATC
jgi:hypothetical protein